MELSKFYGLSSLPDSGFLTFMIWRRLISVELFFLQVVDGLDELINGGCQEQLEIIRQQLQKGVQIGILSKSFPAEVVSATGNWLQHPIVRAALDKSVPASSVCITQSVSVVTMEEAKLSKVINSCSCSLKRPISLSSLIFDSSFEVCYLSVFWFQLE